MVDNDETAQFKRYERVFILDHLDLRKGHLRCKIAQRQAQENKELASNAQDNSTLTYLASTLSSADFFCEVRSIVYSDLFPLPTESTVPSSALIIEQSRNLQFSPSTGPFQPVRLIVYPNGHWRLDSPILEHLVNLAHKWFSKQNKKTDQ